ncbi:magnesium transport protein CorA [Nocardioides flavus (ex Wang et al. 2016)]|uniref:Magnesium transport protein CorA n=1 Tax=Nocardioides flavus (ex Wang et al. 2016) TaxID=2058780 RepID=A0ABQ3HLX6_9ACTN|nr:magnesium/cobalt transporter CorA [Nocardioides flavus (ex Wang et al. 2016)]GHE18668.1 magnesium transport protein CorA [Nocardioides flavus (ex Wang et al. 2016)]
MIVDNALYHHGRRVPVGEGADQSLGSARVPCDPGDFQWIGIHEPSPDELQLIADTFGLHPLAVEDAGDSHQRPKLEHYGDTLFLVLKTLWYVDEEDAVETGEINMFVGADFVVTVRHGEGIDLADSRRDLEERAQVLEHGPMGVMYAICDRVVDEYERVGAALEEDVDEVEESVFSPARTDDANRIYVLKREIAEFRRAVMPLREPMRKLAMEGFDTTGVEGHVTSETATYFRDVSDHLQRVSELVDNLDVLLSTAFDAHLARISVQQNEDMRKISAGAALVVVPTLIAGIYGMNFEHMPELGWVYGYPFALVLMVGVATGLFAWFKKSGWL